ncbi:FadR/GntR family transcriptional regulator [Kitasatospora sp. LaBMicrA B282]|uniref:FadR/GntR family transcriptional regulator n=1 Tax=Kitasatospora sp. LaBMicrA B282 TaxID=3420949 RepID=UPI003D0AA103
MTEAPIKRESVSDQLFSLLRDRILSGALPAGEALTAERDLAAEFGVNRHAVREAVKRLQQARLVEVSQGGRTRVRDWRVSAGLDLAFDVAPGTAVFAGLQRDAMEMRACIGADAARLCAERCTPQQAGALVAAADAYGAIGADLAALDEADVALWRLIVVGSGNLAYLLAFNSLVGGTVSSGEVPPAHRTAELLDVEVRRRLARFVAAGDAGAAEQVAREMLTRTVTAMTRAAEQGQEVTP